MSRIIVKHYSQPDARRHLLAGIVIALGAIADANATFAVKIEEGDTANLADAAEVADVNLIGTEALASFKFDDDNKIRKIGYVGIKRYIRATITPTGNGADALLSAIWILGFARDARPSANPPA